MKTKIIGFLSLIAIIYSCASKPVAAPPQPSPPPAPVEVVKTEEAAVPDVPVAPAGPLGPLSPEEIAVQGKLTYENTCARCHKLFSPTAFGMEDWKPIVLKMQRIGKINDADISLIMDYLVLQQK